MRVRGQHGAVSSEVVARLLHAAAENDAPTVIGYLHSESWLLAYKRGADVLAVALKHNAIDAVAALLDYGIAFDESSPAMLEAATRLPGDVVLALFYEYRPAYVSRCVARAVQYAPQAIDAVLVSIFKHDREEFARFVRRSLAAPSESSTDEDEDDDE